MQGVPPAVCSGPVRVTIPAGRRRLESGRSVQLTREWALLRELQLTPDGRSYTELARTLKTAPRTVYRDLETLRRAGFPLARALAHGKPVWRLAPTGVPGVAFTPAELSALGFARQMLLGMAGSPFDGAMRQAFRKIQAAAGRDGARVLETADRQLFADLRRARPYTEREVWFRMLLDALTRHRTVRLRYFTLERDTEADREVDPYGLVYHEGAFYLVGWCHWRRDVRTFLVDRIRAVAETGRSFALPAGFSVREHFRSAWGLLKHRALVTVRIRFDATVARLIREGRWHETQRLEDAAGGAVVLAVRVAGWEEIRRWVLTFGGAAEVLEPGVLRASLAAEARRLAAMYRADRVPGPEAAAGGPGRRGAAARD